MDKGMYYCIKDIVHISAMSFLNIVPKRQCGLRETGKGSCDHVTLTTNHK